MQKLSLSERVRLHYKSTKNKYMIGENRRNKKAEAFIPWAIMALGLYIFNNGKNAGDGKDDKKNGDGAGDGKDDKKNGDGAGDGKDDKKNGDGSGDGKYDKKNGDGKDDKKNGSIGCYIALAITLGLFIFCIFGFKSGLAIKWVIILTIGIPIYLLVQWGVDKLYPDKVDKNQNEKK